jgi:hypothetical protein
VIVATVRRASVQIARVDLFIEAMDCSPYFDAPLQWGSNLAMLSLP